MSNFWANRLAGQQGPPQPVAPPAANQPWWAPPVLQRPVQPQSEGSPQPIYSTLPVEDPDVPVSIALLLHQGGAYSTDRAQSMQTNMRCPACGGANYMSPAGMPNMMPICADCGQNPRFMHSTQGVTPTSQSEGPPRPTRGNTALGTTMFGNPGTVVGKT